MLSPEAKEKYFRYMKEAPKQCFFSVFNYISSKEAVLITLRHQREIKLLVELYKNKVLESKTPMTDEEFLKYWKELPDDKRREA